MTANDFFLLFVAFGGFLLAPALLLWGIARLIRGKPDATQGPGSRPDRDPPDRSADPIPAERRNETPDFSRRVFQREECLAMA